MKTLSSLGLGTSLIAATVTAATVVAVAPAQAGVLTLGAGDILNITGQSTFDLTPNIPFQTIDFLTGQVESDSTGGFYTNYVAGDATLKTISDIDITRIAGPLYSGVATNPLLKFSDGVKFVANNPFNVTRVAYGEFGVALNFTPFSGTFVNADGVTVAQGLFSAQQFFNGDGSYSMTIKTKDVPEPLTLMGSGLALGFGGLFQRKNASKRKNQKSA